MGRFRVSFCRSPTALVCPSSYIRRSCSGGAKESNPVSICVFCCTAVVESSGFSSPWSTLKDARLTSACEEDSGVLSPPSPHVICLPVGFFGLVLSQSNT